jgi:hypothetical protein
MNKSQKKHYMETFDKRYDHRMEFADFVVDSLLNIPINKFPLKRVYQVYDVFQERLCESELPDGEKVVIKDKSNPVVEITKNGDEVVIHFKAGKKWVDVNCPLELIKFTDWWLYT